MHYLASDRRWPRRLPLVEYPAHLQLRRVSPTGCITIGGTRISLSVTLAGEYVGVQEHADDRWQIRFGPLELGYWVAPDDTFEADLRWLGTHE
jgi:putative transposase